jgi:3-dehydroquinate synthase
VNARRAILVSEPGAWDAVGERLATELGGMGREVVRILLPQGEDAKRLAVVEAAASQLAALRVERSEVLVAVGGGALGDAAGFLAAVYLRGIGFIAVPTTLVAQIDSSIGGKTGVDLPEGKNLVGAFHQPTAIVIDVELLRTLPERQLRAALGEAVKMAALGDERLFELLETDGEAIARNDPAPFASGAVAELVERAGWAKVEVVLADERERNPAGGRITLNLGHSVGHAVEAAAGYGGLLHGEAVAYGLRAAVRIGLEVGVTPADRADRIARLLDRLGLATDPLPYPLATVLGHLATDKKHAAGRLRLILPTADGVIVRDDIERDVVERASASLLAAPSGTPR